ncbi:MAG: hypothetical protein MSS92_06150 [Lachnospiraceae bacterium]|nr:hypothetical protein [Lachnospiraceae bacterium]
MGEIRKYSCICGYSQELFEGSGILSSSSAVIERLFPEAYKEFQTLQKSGQLRHWGIVQRPSLCPACRELCTMPVLLLETTAEGKKEYPKGLCPKCNEALIPPEYDAPKEDQTEPAVFPRTSILCPKCHRPMKLQCIGHWD